jgi:hypothetical protein
MNQSFSNAPMSSGAPTSFYQTWVKALTRPNEQTYAEIASSPDAKATTAYLWVFLSSIVTSLFALIVQGAMVRAQLAQAGVGGDRFGNGVGGVVVTLLCGTPVIALLGTLFFAIYVAIVQWIAKMFGGRGTNDQMAYAFAAIGVPYSLISSVFILLSAIPYVGFCFRLILSIAGIYIFILQLMAVKGVNQFGWGAAFGSVLIPVIALFGICCCVIFALSSVFGPQIGNIIRQINSGLAP